MDLSHKLVNISTLLYSSFPYWPFVSYLFAKYCLLAPLSPNPVSALLCVLGKSLAWITSMGSCGLELLVVLGQWERWQETGWNTAVKRCRRSQVAFSTRLFPVLVPVTFSFPRPFRPRDDNISPPATSSTSFLLDFFKLAHTFLYNFFIKLSSNYPL